MAIQKLKPNEDKIFRTESGEMIVVPALNVPQCISDKINELVDAVNNLQKQYNNVCILVGEQNLNYNPDTTKGLSTLVEEPEPAENVQPVAESRPENVRLPYMQNKRLRKALGVAQSALVKLANDAYDMDEHIYIDKILNQIERITKGGDNE